MPLAELNEKCHSEESTIKHVTRSPMFACTFLASFAAIIYVLLGTGILSIPKIGTSQAPRAIFYIAAACYLGGGLLVLKGTRWLWIVGLVANAWVIAIFFVAYRHEPTMMLSSAGVATKTAQVLLEAGLIYLVASRRPKTPPVHQIRPDQASRVPAGVGPV